MKSPKTQKLDVVKGLNSISSQPYETLSTDNQLIIGLSMGSVD